MYSNHLNTWLVWYSNGRFVSRCQMVRLKTGLKKDSWWSKMSGIQMVHQVTWFNHLNSRQLYYPVFRWMRYSHGYCNHFGHVGVKKMLCISLVGLLHCLRSDGVFMGSACPAAETGRELGRGHWGSQRVPRDVGQASSTRRTFQGHLDAVEVHLRQDRRVQQHSGNLKILIN